MRVQVIEKGNMVIEIKDCTQKLGGGKKVFRAHVSKEN